LILYLRLSRLEELFPSLHCNSRDCSQAARKPNGRSADRKMRDIKINRHPIFLSRYFSVSCSGLVAALPRWVSCAFSRLVPLRLLRRVPPANLQWQGTDAGFCPGCRTSRCSLRPNSRTGCGNGCVRDWHVADDPASLPRISTPPALQSTRRPGPRLRGRRRSHPKPEVIRDS